MNGKSRFICFIWLLFWSGAVLGQTLIDGKVNDTLNQPLPSASIILKDTLGQIHAYDYTDQTGNYRLETKVTGKVELIFSSLGYAPKTIFKILPEGENHVSLNVVLKENTTELEEVLIETKRPIAVEKDTIRFKAKYFTNGTEETVEDLLKKIPGFTVLPNGIIKVGNQDIEKLMVDGDDFFGRGYTLLSKNMPAHPIEEVEVLKHYSENRLLKGIEHSDKIALNLELKESAKRIWFGNLEGALGNDHFYEAKGNLMNFGKKNKYYFLANLNNLGQDPSGDFSGLIKNMRGDGLGDLGYQNSANNLLDLSPPYIGELNSSRTNFNETKLISLNAILNPNKQLKIKPMVLLNRDQLDFYNNTIHTVNTNEAVFTNTENYHLFHQNKIAFAKLDLHYDISETQQLETTTKYNNGSKDAGSLLIFNGNPTVEDLADQPRLFDQTINYTNRFESKKVFEITGRFANEKSPQHYSLNQFYYPDLFPDLDNPDNVKQYSNDHSHYFGLNAHLLNKVNGGDLWDIQLGNEYRKNGLDTQFSVFQGDSLVVSPNEFQNQTQYAVNDLYLKSKYIFEISIFKLTGKVNFHQLFNRLQNGDQASRQNPFFINPSLNLKWDIDAKNSLSTEYSFNTQNAGILDVYDNFVLTGFRSFSKGTGHFDQLKASDLSVYYQLGNWEDRFFANATLVYRKDHDFYSTRTIIQQNFIQSEKIKIKNKTLLNANAQADYFFASVKTDLKANLGYSKSDYKNEVNNSGIRKVVSDNYTYGFSLASTFDGIFNYSIGTEWQTRKIKTSVTNSFTDNKSFLNLFFRFSDKFDIQLKNERYHFGKLEKNKDYYFLDFTGQYKLIRNKLSLGLTGQNLFNNKKFRTYSISDIGTSTTEFRLLPRMVLLHAKFRF